MAISGTARPISQSHSLRGKLTRVVAPKRLHRRGASAVRLPIARGQRRANSNLNIWLLSKWDSPALRTSLNRERMFHPMWPLVRKKALLIHPPRPSAGCTAGRNFRCPNGRMRVGQGPAKFPVSTPPGQWLGVGQTVGLTSGGHPR